MLCSKALQFIYKRDKAKNFIYAALNSQSLDAHLSDKIKKLHPLPDSMLVYHQGRLLAKSEAGLVIISQLGFPINVFGFVKIIPRFIRDAAYDFVAKNRYKWFGRSEEACMWILKEEGGRFLM